MYIIFAILFFIGSLLGTWFESTELTFWFSFAVFFIVLLGVKRGSKLGWLSLSTVCILGFLVYSLATPFHHLIYRDYDDELVRWALLLCCIGAVGYISGIQLSRRKRKWGQSDAHNFSYDQQISIYAGRYILWFGVFSAIIAVGATVGFDAYFQAGYAGRALLKREAGPVELGLYYAIIGYLFIFNGWLAGGNAKFNDIKLIIILFPILFVAYVSFLGIRRPSFFLVLSMIVMYSFFRSKNFRGHHLIIAGVAALLFGLFANFRQVLSDQGWEAAFAFIRENFSLEWFDFSVTELGAPFRALLDVMNLWSDEPLRMGSSYIYAVVNILPSFIYQGPDSLSVEYTNRVFTADYIAIGGNMGFFAVAEGYINFSFVGVFVEFIAIGWFIGWLEKRAFVEARPKFVVGYCLAAPWFYFFLRTDVASFGKVVFYSVFPAFVLYYFLSAFRIKITK